MFIGGGATQALALAPPTISAIQVLEAFAAVSAYAAAVAALGAPFTATDAAVTTLATAAMTLSAPLAPLLGSAPAGIASTRTNSE